MLNYQIPSWHSTINQDRKGKVFPLKVADMKGSQSGSCGCVNPDLIVNVKS